MKHIPGIPLGARMILLKLAEDSPAARPAATDIKDLPRPWWEGPANIAEKGLLGAGGLATLATLFKSLPGVTFEGAQPGPSMKPALTKYFTELRRATKNPMKYFPTGVTPPPGVYDGRQIVSPGGNLSPGQIKQTTLPIPFTGKSIGLPHWKGTISTSEARGITGKGVIGAVEPAVTYQPKYAPRNPGLKMPSLAALLFAGHKGTELVRDWGLSKYQKANELNRSEQREIQNNALLEAAQKANLNRQQSAARKIETDFSDEDVLKALRAQPAPEKK